MIRKGSAALLLAAVLLGCAVPQTFSRQDPGDNEHLLLGVTHERNGEWDQAMQEYTLAAKTDPRGNFYLGNLFFQQNKLDDAEREYRAAMSAMHNDPALYNNLAWLLLTRQTKLEEAEELAGLAVKQSDPEHFAEYWDTLEQVRLLRERKKRNAPAARK